MASALLQMLGLKSLSPQVQPSRSPVLRSHEPAEGQRRLERNQAMGKRNIPYAVPGPWVTRLSPLEEQQFQAWVKQHNVPMEDDGPYTSYDMRGFWKDWSRGDPHAHMGINSVDKRLHFTDYYKTPYHESFNRESKYSKPDNPIHWDYSKGGEMNPTLIGPGGQVLLPPMKAR